VTVVIFEFTFGVLGDLFGRRRLVVVGAVVLALGAVVCALAANVETLWVGAPINGLGAGAMYPGTPPRPRDAASTSPARSPSPPACSW